MTKPFGFHSNSPGADEIKDLPILIDFLVYSCLVLYLHELPLMTVTASFEKFGKNVIL